MCSTVTNCPHSKGSGVSRWKVPVHGLTDCRRRSRRVSMAAFQLNSIFPLHAAPATGCYGNKKEN